MKTILFVFLLLGQDITYKTVTPTNSITCTATNVAPPPAFYSVYWFVPNRGFQKYSAPTVPIPFTNFWSNMTNGIYSVQMTVTLTNGVETQVSTNGYYFWNVPPSLPGAPFNITP